MWWTLTQLTLQSLWNLAKPCSRTKQVFGYQAAVKRTCSLLSVWNLRQLPDTRSESVEIARYPFGVCGHCQIPVRSLVTLADTQPLHLGALLSIMAARTMSVDSDLNEEEWADVTPFLTLQVKRALSTDLHSSSSGSAPLPSASPVKSLPSCPDCGSKMTTRINKSDNGWFLGCSRHPECLGTLRHPSGRFPVQSHTDSSKTKSFAASTPATHNVSNENAKTQTKGFICASCNGFNTYTAGNASAGWKNCKDCGHRWDTQSKVSKGERAIQEAFQRGGVDERGNGH